MKDELIHQTVLEIVEEFVNYLVEDVRENVSSFPVTTACAEFILTLKNQGIKADLNSFDPTTIENVYQELSNSLTK